MNARRWVASGTIVMALGTYAVALPGPGLQSPAAAVSFFGAKPPGTAPELFAPGVVSTGLAERDVTISPDGSEFYFSVSFRSVTAIMVSRLASGRWTTPEVASFAADAAYWHMEPALSADGLRMFFLSNRPPAGQPDKAGWGYQRIWAADRSPGGGWGEPYDIGSPINTDGNSFYPSITRDGTLYFTRNKPGGKDAAVFRARANGRGFAEPERLPDAVNGYGNTYNAFIAPDESYLIAAVEGRDDSTRPKAVNYVVFFRRPDGTWTTGANLGPAVNMPGNSVHAPYVSPDGRYLFFALNVAAPRPGNSLLGLTLPHLMELSGSPRNGNSDIYWVSASVLQALRPPARARGM